MRFAINDGPGIRTTVFLKGCPLSCAWCHNPESQRGEPELVLWADRCTGCGRCLVVCPHSDSLGHGPEASVARQGPECDACGRCVAACPRGAREIAGRRMSAAEVMREVERDTIFYDQSGGGVTFSGGEPLAQPEFLLEMLGLCRAKGIRTAIDTSGHAPWEVLRAAAALTDIFLYDLKLMDAEKHRRWTGCGNELILDNLVRLSRCHESVTVRVPVIPGINDDQTNARHTAEFLRERTSVRRVVLLGYHATGEAKYARLGRAYELTGTGQPGAERLAALARIYEAAGLEAQVGG